MWFSKKVKLHKLSLKQCVHCSGTGKCTCGIDAVRGLRLHHVNGSVKDVIGATHFCCGVCSACDGKGIFTVKTFEEVLK